MESKVTCLLHEGSSGVRTLRVLELIALSEFDISLNFSVIVGEGTLTLEIGVCLSPALLSSERKTERIKGDCILAL